MDDVVGEVRAAVERDEAGADDRGADLLGPG
jgi:hypothetical protein